MADSLSPMRTSALDGTQSRMALSSPTVMTGGLLSFADNRHGYGLFSVRGDGFGLLRAVGGEEHFQRVHGFGLDDDGCVVGDFVEHFAEFFCGHGFTSLDGFDGDFVSLMIRQDDGEGSFSPGRTVAGAGGGALLLPAILHEKVFVFVHGFASYRMMCFLTSGL